MSESSERSPETHVLARSSREQLTRLEPVQLHAVPSEEKSLFSDYWRVLIRRRWVLITFFLVTITVVAAWTFTTRPVFTATATLRLEREEPRVLKFEEVLKADQERDYYQTQHKILQSRTLASRVISLLALREHPEFQPPDGWMSWPQGRVARSAPAAPPPAPEGSEDPPLESPVTRTFQSRLFIEPVRDARLVKVSFESFDPNLAARIANALAEGFIAQHLEQKVEAKRYATDFLGRQMEEARAKLEGSEEKLHRFLERNDILFVTSDRTGERQDLITMQLTILSDALLKARTERIAKESLVRQAHRQDVDSLPAVLRSELVTKLKSELVALEAEYRKLGQTFKPEYPRIDRVEQSIAELRRQLQREVQRVVKGLEADYHAAFRNEGELQGAVEAHRNLVQRRGGQMARYNLLRRDAETNRELYTSLLTRLKETQISSSLLNSNISIVDRAEVPLTPSKPRKALSLLIASLVGLMGGAGLAFFLECLDTNIKDAKEVESALRVPALGFVPSQAVLEGRRASRRAENGGDSGPFALVAHAEMGSILAEAFRNLRTTLLYSAPDRPPKTFMLTSVHTEDGKTSLATNLGIVLAQLGHGAVLLVDGDMRRPNLHDLFRVPQAPGLSTFLTGDVDLSAVIKATAIPNLFVIPTGPRPVKPAELMASARLDEALAFLGERFVHIVFDTPPLFGVSDALILAPRVEGVILVLRHGRATREAAQRAVRLLGLIRAQLLGVVLNDVDGRAAGAGYTGDRDYYGYGSTGLRDWGP